MVGRATDAEEVRQRIVKLMETNLENNVEAVIDEQAKGEVITDNMPEKFNLRSSKQENKNTEPLPITASESQALEKYYRTLFGQDIYKISEDLDEPIEKTASNFEEYELTETGSNIYSNWNSFFHYLSGDRRIKGITSRLKDTEIPRFLNQHTEKEITLNRYLRNPEAARRRWIQDYSPEEEFEEITSVLYSEDTRLGEEIERLYALKNVPGYENGEELQEIGLRGLTDQDGVLNQDGQELYSRVRLDQLYL